MRNILSISLALSSATESSQQQTLANHSVYIEPLKGRLIWQAKNLPDSVLYLLFDMSHPPAIKDWV